MHDRMRKRTILAPSGVHVGEDTMGACITPTGGLSGQSISSGIAHGLSPRDPTPPHVLHPSVPWDPHQGDRGRPPGPDAATPKGPDITI
eukprot:14260154-Alexandrium_andersonii.AAC.1